MTDDEVRVYRGRVILGPFVDSHPTELAELEHTIGVRAALGGAPIRHAILAGLVRVAPTVLRQD